MNPSLEQNENKGVSSKQSWLDGAFPVPHSLILSDIAVDISDGTLRFFEFARSHGELRPKTFGAIPFPRIYTGDLNEKNRNEAAAALKAWATERNYANIRGIIHEDEVYVFKAKVPTKKPKEIREAIEAMLEENVPIPPADAIFEYEAIASESGLDETIAAVSVVSRAATRQYLELFESSGLFVASLETESRALAKTLFPPNDKDVHAVLSICDHHSVVFIVERGAVVFSSSVEVGSNDLNKAIAKTFEISDQKAIELKLEKAFSDAKGDMNVFESMIPVFSTIRDELGKVLVYWKTQGKKELEFHDVSDIVLVGSDSLISGFARYISVTTKIPARTGSVWTNVLSVEESIPNLSRKDSLDYGSVIGALL